MYIDPANITLPLAALGGLISFVSPCVLPLVPAYVGYLAGQVTNIADNRLIPDGTENIGSQAVREGVLRWPVLVHGLFFVLGFGSIFVLLGVSAGLIGQLGRSFIRSSDWVLRIGGLLVIALGLHMMRIVRIPFLYRDTRNQTLPRPDLGYFGSLFMGITFAAGWSPCIGPILAALLTLGASTGSAGRAAVLLTVYAMGLGIPFLLAAFLLDHISPQLQRIQKHMRTIEVLSGVMLIGIGVLIFSGAMQRTLAPLAGNTDFIIKLDSWLVRVAGNR